MLALTGSSLSLTHGRRLPLLRIFHLPRVPPSLPRWNHRLRFSLASSMTSAFPKVMAGRLPHWLFRGLLNVHSRCSPHGSLTPEGAFSRSASGHSSPLDPPRVFPAGARVCRPGFAPGRKMHLIKAHITPAPSGRCVQLPSEGRITSSWELIPAVNERHRSIASLGQPS